MILEHQNGIIKNLLRNLYSGKPKNSQDSTIQSLLKHIDNLTIATVRDRMYKLVFQLIYVIIKIYYYN